MGDGAEASLPLDRLDQRLREMLSPLSWGAPCVGQA